MGGVRPMHARLRSQRLDRRRGCHDTLLALVHRPAILTQLDELCMLLVERAQRLLGERQRERFGGDLARAVDNLPLEGLLTLDRVAAHSLLGLELQVAQ